jgi:NTE family protein
VIRRVPDAKLYTIDVSFAGVPDAEERAYLNEIPTSFVLPDEAVDRLRAAAGSALLNSPDFKRLVLEANGRVVEHPTTAEATTPPQ